MKEYNLIIIGSGGGTKLRPAADLGQKVAIIEKDALGGTCLNRGCIPSKMLIYPADLPTGEKTGPSLVLVGEMILQLILPP
jgi:mycothione reductase